MIDKNLIKASSFVGFSSVISQILGTLFVIILARFYSVNDYGYISYVMNIGGIAVAIVAAGFPSGLVRFISRHLGEKQKIEEYFSNILTITVGLLFIVVSSIIAIYGFNIDIISIVIGLSIVNIYLAIVRGFIDYKKIALFNISLNFIKVMILYILCYVLNIESTSLTIILYAFGGWAAILIIETVYPKNIKYTLSSISTSTMKEVTIYAVPIMISMFAYTVISNLPIIIIKEFYDYELVGIYATALTITTIFNFIPSAIATITMPTISNLESRKEKNNKEIKNYTTQSLKIVLLTGIVIYALILIFGKDLIELIFTEKYSQSYQILLILSVGSIAGGFRNVFCSLWEGIGIPIISTYDIIVASLTCSILGYLFIPLMGPIGAAYGYSLGLLAALLVDLTFWRKYKKYKSLNLKIYPKLDRFY